MPTPTSGTELAALLVKDPIALSVIGASAQFVLALATVATLAFARRVLGVRAAPWWVLSHLAFAVALVAVVVWEVTPPSDDAWSVHRLASGTYGAGKIVFYALLGLGTAELLGRSVPRYWGWAIATVALLASLAFATEADDLQRIYRLQGAVGVVVMASAAWRLHRIDPTLRTRGTSLMAAALVLVAMLSLPYVLDLRYADAPPPGDLLGVVAFLVDRTSVPDLVGQLGIGLAMLALLLDRQAELQRREREAEEALQREGATTVRLETIGRMAATVAHELHNPLTVVIGTAEQLATQPVDPALKRDLDLLVREAMRCRHVAQALLATTRAEAPPMVEVPTARIVRHATDATRLRASAAGVTLRTHVERGVHVLGDPVALEQAVINLVRNAIDATPRGREVDVRAFADGHHAVLAVEDTGSGIPVAIRDRLFEPLQTTKPVGRGTGLGLAIVRGIVQRHGGTVTLETQPMRLEGTRFVIRLPRVASSWESSGEIAVDAVRTTEERANRTPAPAAPALVTGAVPTRALVVDDEEGIREMLGRTLERYGFAVVEAADGIAAQAVLAADDAAATIAVVFCDVHMPRLGGDALAQWLATACPALLPRTVLLTGDSSTEALQAMVSRLGCQLLAKPFARRDLERVLGRVRTRLGLR
jgi:signal transduction histidine kinase/ActR/RegA family two-component response regulator